MAKIPKSGIANAQTIQASHITNIIEALDGTGSYDVVATGSFTGSFTGDGSNITGVTAEWDGTYNGNAQITGSLTLTDVLYASDYIWWDDFLGSGFGGRLRPNTLTLNRSWSLPNATGTIALLNNSGSGLFQASGSFSGSFVGDGSGLDGVVATTLFALSEGSGVSAFTFDGTSTQTINISGSVGLTTDTITKWTGDAFADTSITDDGAVVNISSDTTVTGSLTATGLTQGGGTDTVAMYDTGSGQFFYTSSAAIGGGGGSDTNFANTDLTFTGNRLHDLDGNYIIIGDGTAAPNQCILYLDDGLGGGAMNIGVGLNYFAADGDESSILYGGQNRLNVLASETVVNQPGADLDFRVESDTNQNMLFVDGETNRVGIGKNSPNATLDVNGNAIISGSLTMESGQRIFSSTLAGLDNMNPTGTKAVRDSQVVKNSVSIVSNISGSGAYPGMNVMIDLRQSSTNPIRYVLSPIGEYTLGSSYVFYLSDSPAGGTEFFRIQTSGGGEVFIGTIAALSSPISVNSATTIETNAGAGNPGDRITITKISDSIWQVEGSMKDGSNWTVS